MKIGDEIFVINICESEGDYYSNFKPRKKAQLLTKLKGVITEIISNNEIKYKFGEIVHNGDIGYDCFLTENEAIERVNGLNKYFEENGCLLK